MPMINAVAMQDDEIKEDISNKRLNEIYNSAEEYANDGIDILLEDYLEDMDTIINDWHLEIDNIINNKNIFDKIDRL